MKVSVIIPVGPGDAVPHTLLAAIPAEWEVIVTPPAGSRAEALNKGAADARHEWLWFLHADSAISASAIQKLREAFSRKPDALHYFDLSFGENGPPLMQVNEGGVWIRSHLLGLPFGDQGFAMRRDVFERAGRYPEDVARGEDHSLIWRARRAGVRLNPVGATIITSPRKYAATGWLKMTSRHLGLTLQQAYNEWRR